MVVAAGQPQGVLWTGCLLLALWAGSVAQAATPSALNLAAADASCLVFQVGTYGFAAHMNNIVEGAVMTKNKNQYYVNDTSFVYKCKDDNAWTSLFSSNNPWPKVWPKEKVELKTDAGEPCVPVNYGFTHGISDFLPDDNEAFDKIGNALIEMWSFEPETQAFIEKHNAWMDQMIKPIIAIHVRGGDKAAEDKKFKWLHMGPSDYWMAMGKVFPELRGKSGTCLFIGDDYNELSQVAASVATFSRCTILMEVPPQYGKGGHDQKTFNELAPKCDLTRLLIADIEAMARADYFIGSYTSNVSRLTQLLRVHKYNRTKESGTDVLLRPWVATPFSHPRYQVGRK